VNKYKTLISTIKLAYKADKFYVLGLLTSSILRAVAKLGEIYSAKLMVDAIIQFDSNMAIISVCLYAITWITLNVLAHFKEYLINIHVPKINYYLDNLIISKIDRLSLGDIQKSSFSDLYVNIQTFGKQKFATVVDNSGELIQSFASFLISLVAILNQNYIIGIIVAIFALFEAFLYSRMAKGMKGVQDSVVIQRKELDYYTKTAQDIRSFLPLKVFNIIRYLKGKVVSVQNEIHNSLRKYWVALKIRAVITGTITNLLGRITPIGFFAYQAAKGVITLGDFVLLRGLIDQYFFYTFVFYSYLGKIYEDTLYISDLFTFLDMEEPKSFLKMIDVKKIGIQVKDVSFKYPDSDRFVLQDINLNIKPGERVAILGINGAGKSTLVKLLSGYFFPTSGEVLVNGHSTEKINTVHFRNNIAFMTQDILHLYLPVDENVKIGDLDFVDDEKVIKSLEKSTLLGDVAKMPNGFTTVLGTIFKGGIDLSGGQWQKLALARAFYRDAKLIFLDEPTSSIDSENEEVIFNNIFDDKRDKTYVIISHKFSNINNADRIIVLDGGKITEEGTHDELMNLKGKYWKMYNKQKKGFIK
jgi:ATP-binding cassette subfamily B protein